MGMAAMYRRARNLTTILHLGSQGTCPHQAKLKGKVCSDCYVNELVAMQAAVTWSLAALSAAQWRDFETRLDLLDHCDDEFETMAKQTADRLLAEVGLTPR